MSLSLKDKVALIYTQFGSQRATADFLGISHQKVGRILKTGLPELGGYAFNSRALRNPELEQVVDFGLLAHTELAREQAKRDGIPFSAKAPVFANRLIRTTGELSDRIVAPHTHWLSDELRNQWIGYSQKTGKYLNVSVRSTVNLFKYNAQAEQREKERAKQGKRRGKRSAKSAIRGKLQIQLAMADGIEHKPVYTPKTSMDPNFPTSLVIADIEDNLTRKHQPATGDPKTAYADSIVLQLDTSAKTQRDYGKNTKRQKARGNQSRANRNRGK